MKQTLLISLIVTFGAITVNAYDFQTGKLRYTITSVPDKTVEVLKSDNTTGDVVIPATVGYNGVDFTVTRIADNAFEYCHNITSFTIPNIITSIGKLGFGWC